MSFSLKQISGCGSFFAKSCTELPYFSPSAAGRVNPAYSSSTKDMSGSNTSDHHYRSIDQSAALSTTHQYKSLKKPNQDMGPGEYTDPDKYTAPPDLPSRSTIARPKDEEVDEDYVSQGSAEPVPGEDGKDYYTLEPPNPSNRDDGNDANTDYSTLEPTKPSNDYVDVDASSKDAEIDGKGASSDYVDVDAPDAIDVDSKKDKEQSNDYVDVDAKD